MIEEFIFSLSPAQFIWLLFLSATAIGLACMKFVRWIWPQ